MLSGVVDATGEDDFVGVSSDVVAVDIATTVSTIVGNTSVVGAAGSIVLTNSKPKLISVVMIYLDEIVLIILQRQIQPSIGLFNRRFISFSESGFIDPKKLYIHKV